MKKILFLFAGLNLLLFAVLAGLFLLAETSPLHPGAPFYKVQHTAEQWRMRLTPGEGRRAEIALDLVERRLTDLASAKDDERVHLAAVAVDQALDDAVRRVAATSQQGIRDGLYKDLVGVLGRAEQVVASLGTEGQQLAVIALEQKITLLQRAGTPEQMAALVPERNTLFGSEPVPFLSQEVDHSAYPLTGRHAEAECTACHGEGQYADTPAECESCHELPPDRFYPDHFAGACEDCHGVDDWTVHEFDHEDIVECRSCHLDDVSSDHYVRRDEALQLVARMPQEVPLREYGRIAVPLYPGNCKGCHPNVADWQDVTFDHDGFSNCRTCHLEDDTPESHYPGQCSTCHIIDNWEEVEYDHESVLECVSCHLTDSPLNHYARPGGQVWYVGWLPESSVFPPHQSFVVGRFPSTCVNCHTNAEDWEDASFDHTGFRDCESCHLEDDTPDDHYAGQCSNCHNVLDWEDATFDHTGFPDCQECHVLEEAHDPGQCSICHTVLGWEEVVYDHRSSDRCVSCHAEEAPDGHYASPCSACHNDRGWDEVSFDHTGYTECATCHVRSDHYHQRCARCHSTTDWGVSGFSHAGYVNCDDCHGNDVAVDHYGSRCSRCHGTTLWQDVRFDHSGYDDCQACHAAPAGHYDSECSTCHDTYDWQQVLFDHSPSADCLSCHTVPAGHYPGHCYNCHHCTCDWSNVDFDHTGFVDCESCHTAPGDHYSGQCSICHTTCGWTDISFSHDGLDDCQGCHVAPDGHWPGQCSNCHFISVWSDINFDHTTYTNCKACHSSERPSDHVRGQCSKCHTTESWQIVVTPTPIPTDIPASPTPIPTDIPASPTPTTTSTSVPPTPTYTPTPMPPTPTYTPTPIPPTPTYTSTPIPPTPTPTSTPTDPDKVP